MARPRTHDDQLRARLLARAGELVSRHGVEGLTVRGLAAAEDTSTTAVYALFGGKPELLAALHGEAFRSFGLAQRLAPRTGDPAADLQALGAAYRGWALANPALYAVMFGGSLAGFQPDAAGERAAEETMAPLIEVVTAAVTSGRMTGDPFVIVMAIWGLVHGLVSLELSGSCPPQPLSADEVYRQATDAIVGGLLVYPPG